MTANTPHTMEGREAPAMTPRGGYAGSLSPEAFLSLGSMEGMFPAIVEAAPAKEVPSERVWPGFLVAGGIAAASYLIHYIPVTPFTVSGGAGLRHPISAAIIAILVGLLARNTLALPDSIKVGCKRAIRKGIPLAIVCTGAGLSLLDVAGVGATALVIIILCMALAIAGAYYIGRLFGLSHNTSLLLGAGTGICGNSAIVAVAPLIDAKDDDVALSVGTVNLVGLVAMLALPALGGWLAMSDEAFGVWSGTSIHAVPQVVAAGFAFSPDAGTIATLVKLVRVALLAPLVFMLAMVAARNKTTSPSKGPIAIHYARFVPWFVWGFAALAIVNTLGLIPTLNFTPASFLGTSAGPVNLPIADVLKFVGKLLLTFAMAAIGLEVDIRQLAGVGGRAIAAGMGAGLALAAASLALVWMLL